MTKHPPKKETASCAIIEKRNNSVPQKEKHLTQIKEWDFEGAKQEFERTISLNPGYATAHHWYGHYCTTECYR